MTTHVVIDGDYLAHRAFFALHSLTHEGVRTGMLYGFMRDSLSFRDLFNTHSLIFCFDHGPPLRSLKLLPGYKSTRKRKLAELPPDQREMRLQMKGQIQRLRDEYLTAIGFRNVFHAAGYEADDLVAKVCDWLPEGDDAVVVSADEDLYQLLADDVVLYKPKPKETYTAKKLLDEYGVTPAQWADVKAVAGCAGDDVPGVAGVGNKTAAKYVTGALSKRTATWDAIKEARAIIERNRRLTKLPYPGAPDFVYREDQVSAKAWRNFCDEFGMMSIVSEISLSGRPGLLSQVRGR